MRPDSVAGRTVAHRIGSAPSSGGHGERRPHRKPARPVPGEPRVVVHECGVHQRLVGLAEHRIVESEPGGETPEDLGVRQRLADRRDDRLRPLQMADGRTSSVDVGELEVARGRQHHVAVAHRVRHHHVGAGDEHVLARERPAHAILVRMGRDRVVIVDEHRPDRRDPGCRRAAARETSTMLIVRVPCGHEVRALQPVGGPRKGMAGLGEHAGAEAAMIAGEGLECHRSPQSGTAAASPFNPVAHRHPDRPSRRSTSPRTCRTSARSTPHTSATISGRVRARVRHVGIIRPSTHRSMKAWS